jgi:ribosomal protein L11
MRVTKPCLRDFFLDKQREKAKLEAETKLMVTMKQFIPAGEAESGPPLGVVLSQYYLNLAIFCKDFNTKTSHYEPGILLPVKVNKGLRAKEYKLFINKPSLSFLIWSTIRDNDYSISVQELFGIIQIVANGNQSQNLYKFARVVFGTLSTFNRRRILSRRRIRRSYVKLRFKALFIEDIIKQRSDEIESY